MKQATWFKYKIIDNNNIPFKWWFIAFCYFSSFVFISLPVACELCSCFLLTIVSFLASLVAYCKCIIKTDPIWLFINISNLKWKYTTYPMLFGCWKLFSLFTKSLKTDKKSKTLHFIGCHILDSVTHSYANNQRNINHRKLKSALRTCKN